MIYQSSSWFHPTLLHPINLTKLTDLASALKHSLAPRYCLTHNHWYVDQFRLSLDRFFFTIVNKHTMSPKRDFIYYCRVNYPNHLDASGKLCKPVRCFESAGCPYYDTSLYKPLRRHQFANDVLWWDYKSQLVYEEYERCDMNRRLAQETHNNMTPLPADKLLARQERQLVVFEKRVVNIIRQERRRASGKGRIKSILYKLLETDEGKYADIPKAILKQKISTLLKES